MQHTAWDHAIELLPGAPHTLPGQLLPLTQAEIAETHKFIEEHLQRITIRKSISVTERHVNAYYMVMTNISK